MLSGSISSGLVQQREMMTTDINKRVGNRKCWGIKNEGVGCIVVSEMK